MRPHILRGDPRPVVPGPACVEGLTVLATYLTGMVADRYSFRPVLIVASAIPIVAAAAILILVRNNSATRRGLVYPI